ncbi:8-demethyl-8-alpha-L-rhamnosyl tetracenomycin-C 2'-O-methyltransferase [Tolypocladium capitatum]|uniref:8-demethyl-8-alpha-L-rhamnosyl tetracenomycin-C 2'-O-methyltransferase n=1 Tax=Tolypocladium capitatum TaxID=45235 RepID=A0A2K3QBG4_9HYPO|nr:8-demethyl-8-alpha-L-rhamnosyl tetracenomycin-C 2'-O-methyltransferase [Tolypocladium capitatum]
MNRNRMLFPLFTLAAVLLLVALFHQLGCGTSELLQTKLTTHFNGSPNDRLEPPSFEQIARKYGTDKVTGHSYQSMYEKYLSPLRNLPVKMLEIGLGCNMDYGPGASYYTWLEYFHNVELYFIESEAACAEKYKDKTASAHVFTGDQADAAFLEQFAVDTTADGQFDIIIDDGGHTMEQQITSLEHLWPIVKPGGLYVIEDLQTSFWEDYGGDPFTTDRAKHTTMKYLYHVLDDIMVGRDSKPISHDLLSVDCMAEICTLQKRIVDA